MSIELYKPTMMFSQLLNLPATFQAMMNNILRELINIKEVVFFIDNVLVRIDIEKKHNRIVEEVPKRVEENNFYVKLEKCV